MSIVVPVAPLPLSRYIISNSILNENLEYLQYIYIAVRVVKRLNRWHLVIESQARYSGCSDFYPAWATGLTDTTGPTFGKKKHNGFATFNGGQM